MAATAVESSEVRDPPAFARRPVLVLALLVGAVLTAVSGLYGYFGDELYFVAAGHHLAWGYVDQPPLLPLLAVAADTVAPGSVMVLRIPATLATMAAIVLTALLARELGGGRKAQLLAAGALAISPIYVGGGHLLATSTLDPVLWIALTYVLVRWQRTREDRMLLLAGVITAVALQVKFLVVGFWVVAVLALLVCGPRAIFRRPAFWLGGLIAAVVTVPTLVWQAQNGWPQLDMARQVSAESVYTGGALGFVPFALVLIGLLVGTALALHGEWQLLRDPELRWLGVTMLGLTLLFAVVGGRAYYVAGIFPLLWAASAARIEVQRRTGTGPSVWWRWIPTWPVYGLSVLMLLGVMDVLPVKPVSFNAGKPASATNFLLDEVGWPEYSARVEAAYRALPDAERRDAVVVADTYWTYSAVRLYDRDLPTYGFVRGPAWFGVPPESSGAVVLVGDPAPLAGAFSSVTPLGKLDNGVDVNDSTQGTPIFLLQGRHVPWTQLWAQIRHL